MCFLCLVITLDDEDLDPYCSLRNYINSASRASISNDQSLYTGCLVSIALILKFTSNFISTAKMRHDLLRTMAAELQQLLSTGDLTNVNLMRQCHQQMLDHDNRLKAMISISPLSYTVKVATQLNQERKNGSLHGPLHGTPLTFKVFPHIKILDGCRN